MKKCEEKRGKRGKSRVKEREERGEEKRREEDYGKN